MEIRNKTPLEGMGRGEGSLRNTRFSSSPPHWIITSAEVAKIRAILEGLREPSQKTGLGNMLTIKQFAEKMGVATMTVQKWVEKGRIAGTTTFGGVWAIPADAPRPVDLRKTRGGAYAVPTGAKRRPGRPKKNI